MSQQHLIGRMILELDTGDLADVWGLQEEVSRVFQQQAVPAIGQLFDRLVGLDQVVRFDQVVVEVGSVDRQFLADELSSQLLASLHQVLSNALEDAGLDEQLTRFALPSTEGSLEQSTLIKRNRVGADWEVLLYFLQYGRLPWWITLGSWQNWLSRWEAALQSSTSWHIPLQRLLTTNSAAQQRLIEQFPESFRHQIIVQMQPTWAHWFTLLAQARHLMQTLGLRSSQVHHLERQAWRSLFSNIPLEQTSMQSLAALWTRNCLEFLVQTYLDEVAPEILEQRPDFLYQHLQTILETLPAAEQSVWLTALNLVMPSADRSTLRSNLEIWIDFLRQGRLPLGQSMQDWLTHWEAVMQSDTNWREDLRAVIVAHPTARQRLVEQFPISFRQQLIEQMRSVLATVSPSEQALWLALIDQTASSLGSSDLEIWIDFLRQGRLPQGQSMQDWLTHWEAVMQSDTNWRDPLQAVLAANQGARSRLIEQLPEAFRHQLIVQMQPLWIGWYALLTQARQVMQGMNLSTTAIAQLEKQAWLVLLSEIVQRNERFSPLPTATWIRAWLVQLVGIAEDASIAHQCLRANLEATALEDLTLWLTGLDQAIVLSSLQNQRHPPHPQSSLSPKEETSGLYITQAGLVLLHPFLSVYFEAVGLLEGDAFRDETAQQSALYLLHYLATKQTDAPEYELVLPKLLCGWALDQPVVRGLELPIAALQEGERLLQTVIDYWEVLKSTSPDGLREGFLQRQGKLTRSGEGNWKLQVEPSAIDILLDRLPWGLSMVKLPWMSDLLTVEWS